MHVRFHQGHAAGSRLAKGDQALLTDSQTSGLLVSCDAASVGTVMNVFRRHGFDAVAEIGEITALTGGAHLSVR